MLKQEELNVEVEEQQAEVEDQEQEADTQEPDTGQEEQEQDESDDTNEEDESEEETIITLDDEPIQRDEANENNHVVRKLRNLHKEQKQRIKELEEKLNITRVQEELDIKAPVEPNIEDFNYDYDKYKLAVKDYTKKQIEFEHQQNKKLQQQEQEKELWNQKRSNYETKKTELNFSDFEEVEDAVGSTLKPNQIGALIDASDNPALLVYALGKNPAKLKELSEIKNPVRFIAELVRTESKLKMTKKKKPKASPERVINGSSAPSDNTQKKLNELYEKAQRTGSLKELRAYKKKHNIK